MITKLNKNVLLIKDIPSNLIEEAILILKIDDQKKKTKTQDIIMLETKELINDCNVKLQAEYETKRMIEKEKEYKRKKQKVNLLALLGFALFTLAIVLIVN